MALIVRHLHKTYGSQVALNNVDLTLSGGVVALLGANGSGKSTLLRILATLLKPDLGDISFGVWSYRQHERQLRTQIGYLPQDLELLDSLTTRSFLHYLARLRGGQVESILAKFQLQTVADQPIRNLSSGQIRRVSIAQAFLGSPCLLLLDELTRGLDVTEEERIFRLLAQNDSLVIFSTHIPEQAAHIAQTVIVLHTGRVLFCGTPDELRAIAAGQVYELTVSSDSLPQLTTSLHISRVFSSGVETRLRVIGKPAFADSLIVNPSLEDAYLLLTHGVKVKESG